MLNTILGIIAFIICVNVFAYFVPMSGQSGFRDSMRQAGDDFKANKAAYEQHMRELGHND